MKKNLRLGLGVLATIALVAALAAHQQRRRPPKPDFPKPRSGSEARSQDLAYFENYLTLDKSYSESSRVQAGALLNSMKRQVSELSEVAFYMGIRRIVALANNGHSNASLASAAERFGTLPIRLYWFDDGLYVVATETKHSDLLGGRLTHIGDFSIEETAQRLRNCVGGTDDFYRAYYAPGMLTIPAFLFEVGVAPDPHRVRIRVRKDSEPVIERILEAVPGRPAVRSSGALDPRVFDGEVKRWQTLHRVDYQRPLFLQEPDEPFRVIALPDLEALYLQFRANRNQPGRPIRAFLKQARDRIGQLKPTHLILDLRFNGGGDLTTTWRFMRELPELVPSRGRVFVITHQATFSAAIYSFAFAKAADPRRVISVGGHVGDREEFWAEAPGVFRLPNSGIGISYALEKHDLATGCPDPAICHLARQRLPNPTVGKLAPDIPVSYTFQDYWQGHDPVLRRIEQWIRNAPSN